MSISLVLLLLLLLLRRLLIYCNLNDYFCILAVPLEAHTNHHDTRVIFITYPADARSEAIADARWSAPSEGIAVIYIENVLTYVR